MLDMLALDGLQSCRQGRLSGHGVVHRGACYFVLPAYALWRGCQRSATKPLVLRYTCNVVYN